MDVHGPSWAFMATAVSSRREERVEKDTYLRHAILDLVQRNIQPELRRRIRERVPSRLTRKRRATRQPRVDLDDAVLL